VIVKPGARLLHGVAVLDTVDGDGHFRCIPEMALVVLPGRVLYKAERRIYHRLTYRSRS
jgi:hypothetical protein